VKTIQIVLIILSLLAAILGSMAFGSKLAYRVLAAMFFFVAAGFVMFPDTTTAIANVLGVARGADLLLYLVIFAGVHGLLLLYMRTRRLERKVTDLTRTIAIANAERLGLRDRQPRSPRT
jgi:small membrane protein